ncbi:hypothetical protein SCLCIDRAFT_491755 [Scleroderma citrinum Foug A]|uniref:Uncharacterized protein n=1 Tax=Scleroderma citrinum Foug A TaxID=1036808 RepID=A0A0C3EP04_9AGAM|nr:hypothetical protein SCLCIDRAFT_491755 [Scleroderma citrinum Foug A]
MGSVFNFGLERLHTISGKPNDIELGVRQVKSSYQLRCIYVLGTDLAQSTREHSIVNVTPPE